MSKAVGTAVVNSEGWEPEIVYGRGELVRWELLSRAIGMLSEMPVFLLTMPRMYSYRNASL